MNVLGIDIGTTSVKVILSNLKDKKILNSIVKDTNSTILNQNQYYHEQSVEQIFDTIREILNEMIGEDLEKVGHIGISGQMHGVLLWNDDKDESGYYRHSNLITWMDQRCNIDYFINSLPKMPSYLVSEMLVSSGYGCATIYYLNKFDQTNLNQWKYAGNIVDFFACQLCDISRPVMSSQMAHSWGYFDLIHNCWFSDILKQNNFPIQFLPEVNNPGTILGKTKNVFKTLPENAYVYIGMGDLQCSMFYALRTNLNAAINMSTSSQFVVRVTLEDLKQLNINKSDVLHLPEGLVINPFFNGDYLLVAASLNGGNVLAHFVTVLQMWISKISGVDVLKDKIWSTLLSSYPTHVSGKGDELPGQSLIIDPIIYGERHCPNAGATVSNIYPYNCNLDDVYKSICYGIVKNLTKLLPIEMIAQLNVRRLTCSGGLVSRHKCIEDVIKNIYGETVLEINFKNDYDACVGVVDYLCEIIKF